MKMLSGRAQALGFAERARKNLSHIVQQRQLGADVHEVTQIVLSLLGIVVIPWERKLKEGMQHRELEELYADGWPRWQTSTGDTPNLRYLTRRLRNATAHGRFEFSSDSREPEEVVLFVHDSGQRGNDVWEATISAADLREFCYKFLDLIDDELG